MPEDTLGTCVFSNIEEADGASSAVLGCFERDPSNFKAPNIISQDTLRTGNKYVHQDYDIFIHFWISTLDGWVNIPSETDATQVERGILNASNAPNVICPSWAVSVALLGN